MVPSLSVTFCNNKYRSGFPLQNSCLAPELNFSEKYSKKRFYAFDWSFGIILCLRFEANGCNLWSYAREIIFWFATSMTDVSNSVIFHGRCRKIGIWSLQSVLRLEKWRKNIKTTSKWLDLLRKISWRRRIGGISPRLEHSSEGLEKSLGAILDNRSLCTIPCSEYFGAIMPIVLK